MGKGTDWDSPYYTRRKETDDLAKTYGVNREDYIEADIDGERGMTADGYKDYEKAISNAAANDYDTRRSLEAAKQAGYEGADSFGQGISNLQETENAYKFLSDYGKNELGINKFSSANDFGQVTNSFVNMDRKNFTEKMENSFGDYASENGQQNEQPTTELPRDTLQDTDAYQYFQQFQRDPAEMEVFGQPKDQPTPEGDQGEITIEGNPDQQRGKAAMEFANNYKLDLVKGLNLKPQIS